MQQLELQFQKRPELRIQFQQQKDRLRQALKQAKSMRTAHPNSTGNLRTTATIPVVFHIVTPNPNSVTDAQIQAQLDTLNRDFAGTNGDASKVPSYFKPFFGSSGIQFCLAKQAPDGSLTTGIERITSTESYSIGSESMKYASTGGATIWDPSRYFNVWLCPLSGGILGFSTFPNTAPENEQGCVVDYRSLPGGSYSQYNTGKTLTHEAGHYFNLFHTWGDDEEDKENGVCFGSDYIDDTPNQAVPTYGSLTGVITDSCTPGGNGIMYQNYMDYTDDKCLVMFTNDQVTVMEDALLQFRSSLLTSNGCTPGKALNYDAELATIASPQQRICTSDFSASIIVRNRGVLPLTSLVVSAKVDGGAPVNLNWTGSLNFMETTTISFGSLTAGVGTHTLTMYLSNPNNNQDESTFNDTVSTSFQYYAPVTSVSESFETNMFPPASWDVVNASNDTTWQRFTGAAKTGNASVYINNFYNGRTGDQDLLRLPNVSITGVDSAFLSFQVAYATFSEFATPNNTWDTLEVLASTDCGATYTSLYKKWGGDLATRQTPTQDEFVPTASQWRKDSVNLINYIGQTNLLLAFKNTNGYENNLYLDDINLRTVYINPNLRRLGFMVTPNPSNGIIAARFYPTPTNLVALDIYNATGQKLKEVSVNKGAASNYYTLDISNYAAGTYYVRAVFSDRVITRKILKY